MQLFVKTSNSATFHMLECKEIYGRACARPTRGQASLYIPSSLKYTLSPSTYTIRYNKMYEIRTNTCTKYGLMPKIMIMDIYWKYALFD